MYTRDHTWGVEKREIPYAPNNLAPTTSILKKKHYSSPTHIGGGDDLGNGRLPSAGELNAHGSLCFGGGGGQIKRETWAEIGLRAR